ncbi:dehydrogenase [Kalaharituber pfeilii]|nr:dehydrogenase [Kalaharituber pfeilii]
MTGISNVSRKRVWFITGCATNSLGWYIALSALSRGDYVIVTSRNPSKNIAAPLSTHPNATLLALDVFWPESRISETVAAAIAAHGHIDILVNSAGGALAGPIEETSTEQMKDHYHLNVFSPIIISKLALPHMRSRRSGTIIMLGSIAAWGDHNSSGWGLYCSTKSALIAVSKTLREEVAPFGIAVTVVEPGYFRTEVLNSSRGMAIADYKGQIEDYAEMNKGLWEMVETTNGKQAGDPKKGGEKMVQAILMEEPDFARWRKDGLPERWGLGDDAAPHIEERLNYEMTTLARWKGLTGDVSF